MTKPAAGRHVAGCDEWLRPLSAARYELDQFTAVRPAAPLPPT